MPPGQVVVPKSQLEAALREENQLIRSGVLRDENPFNSGEDFLKFLQACRQGDLKSCQEQISGGVDINGKDRYDYTPLIVASLCGHYEVVQLLLESGARAERNTFQGERAVYNALNHRIRNLLLSYDYSKSTDPLQPWSMHITSLLARDLPQTADINLTAGMHTFPSHKFILSARSSYFSAKLANAPETDNLKLSTAVPVEAYRTVFNYLYLEEVPQNIVDPNDGFTDEDQVLTGIDKLSKQLGVEELWDAMLHNNNRRIARQKYQDEVNRANEQIMRFFRQSIVGHKMTVDSRRVKDVKWRHDNAIFADCLLRADEEPLPTLEPPKESEINGVAVGPLALPKPVNGQRNPRSVLYPVHRAMLIRSPYFAAMFSSAFAEAQESEYLHVVTLDCTPPVLEIVLTFLYTEQVDCTLENALGLLRIADFLLLDKLKVKAAAIISTLGSGNSNAVAHGTLAGVDTVPKETLDIYEVIRAAWLLNVQRLEEFAARYFAARLEDYIDDPEFAAVIQESAARVIDRQETDTIELLDDIRFYLSERFRLRAEDPGFEDLLDEEEEGQGEAHGSLEAPLAVVPNGHETAKVSPKETTQSKNVSIPPAGSPNAATTETPLMAALNEGDEEDQREMEAFKYDLLMEKIDALLEKLNLDA